MILLWVGQPDPKGNLMLSGWPTHLLRYEWVEFWEPETTSALSYLPPHYTGSPMNFTKQEVERRSNPCRGLSCEHLDSNIFMSLTF